jgi:hypothetical protein
MFTRKIMLTWIIEEEIRLTKILPLLSFSFLALFACLSFITHDEAEKRRRVQDPFVALNWNDPTTVIRYCCPDDGVYCHRNYGEP